MVTQTYWCVLTVVRCLYRTLYIVTNLLGQDLGGFDETESSTCPGPKLVPSPVPVPVPGPGLKVFRFEGAASPVPMRAPPIMLRSASTGATLCSRTSSDEAGPPTTPLGARGQAHTCRGICANMHKCKCICKCKGEKCRIWSVVGTTTTGASLE